MEDIKEIEKFAESEENSRIRAEIWGDFVGWSGQRRGENGFLVQRLNRYEARTVLDVAAGDGADAIFLLKQGFEVVINELDSAFRKKAIENIEKAGYNLNPTSVDWRNLLRAYDGDSQDALICMGNSLPCIEGSENQLNALREFRKILKPVGVLLIDERNYQKILDNREGALAGTLHSSGKQLYTGTDKVKTRFLKVTEQEILIEYTHIENGKTAYYKV